MFFPDELTKLMFAYDALLEQFKSDLLNLHVQCLYLIALVARHERFNDLLIRLYAFVHACISKSFIHRAALVRIE